MTDEQKKIKRLLHQYGNACFHDSQDEADEIEGDIFVEIAALEGEKALADIARRIYREGFHQTLRDSLDAAMSTPSTDGDSVSMNGENVDKNGYFFGDEYVPDQAGEDEMPKWVQEVLRKAAMGYYGTESEKAAKWLSDALEKAREERDLAIAHDRQPYPTAEAYELACKARDRWQARAEAAEASLTASSAVAVRELKARLAKRDYEVKEIIDVAHKHGWNGVENSKILSVFLDSALSRSKRSRPSPSRPAGGDAHG